MAEWLNMDKLNNFGGTIVIISIVFTSLLLSTALISYFLLNVYGLSVAGLDLPNNNPISFSSHQNFTSNSINTTTLDYSQYGKWEYQTGIGRVLTQKGTRGWSYLLINNIQKDEKNIITNTYSINNSVKSDYTIVLRYTGGSDQNELTISNDGVHVPSYLGNIVISSPLVISYPNLNQIEDVTITTIYNDELRTCDMKLNNIQFTQIQNLYADTNVLNIFGRYYGGVASDTLKFTIKDFKSDNSISYDIDNDMLAQTSAFFVTMGKLIILNVDSKYLPDILNIILIKSQTCVLLIAIIALWRGVG